MGQGRPPGSRTAGGAPTALKLLRGGHPELINNDEPMPEEGIPECPSTDREVIEVWEYTVRQLDVMRTITMADRDVLHAYCEAVVTFRRASRMIHRDGIIIDSHRGPIKHPASSVMREASNLMKDYARHFGLTPSARGGLKVAESQVQEAIQNSGPSRLLSG
jgi:P27 family predicted phage terminase small subunit